MASDNHRTGPGSICCESWWDSLTPVQRMWLHAHLWDLEILAGWSSKIMVQSVSDHHTQRTDRYTPTHNGSHE